MRRFWLPVALLALAPVASACFPPGPVCPAIAQAPVVTVTVLKSYVPAVRTLHLKACQSGACKEADLELAPGTKSVDQGCGEGPDGVCSATASPDGTLFGHLWLEVLTEDPIDATLSGIGTNGSALPVRSINFRPKANYPFGLQCGKFITASLLLDADGLRQA